jgi:hypothetical protein
MMPQSTVYLFIHPDKDNYIPSSRFILSSHQDYLCIINIRRRTLKKLMELFVYPLLESVPIPLFFSPIEACGQSLADQIAAA